MRSSAAAVAVAALSTFTALVGAGCLDRQGLEILDGGMAGIQGQAGGAGGGAYPGTGGPTYPGSGGRTMPGTGGRGVGCDAICGDVYCRYGYVNDANGCPTCNCKPAPGSGGSGGSIPGTGGRTVGSGGAGGTKGTGGTGGKPACGPVCAIYCPYGNVLDPNGCPTCSCNPPPSECKPEECPAPPPTAGIAIAPRCDGGPVVPGACVRGADGVCYLSAPRCGGTCLPLTCDLVACPYGQAVDVNGCLLCQCNPPPSCTTAECGPTPPKYVCPDGVNVSYPIACSRADATGVCGWTILECPRVCPTVACLVACPNGYRRDANGCGTCECLPANDCATRATESACGADASCKWLVPGCTTPALAAPGCYSVKEIGCASDNDCASGRTCLKRQIDPCNGRCDACSTTQTICL